MDDCESCQLNTEGASQFGHLNMAAVTAWIASRAPSTTEGLGSAAATVSACSTLRQPASNFPPGPLKNSFVNYTPRGSYLCAMFEAPKTPHPAQMRANVRELAHWRQIGGASEAGEITIMVLSKMMNV